MQKVKMAILVGFGTLLAVAAVLFSQQPAVPLTNADVVKMVKSNLPESVIVSAIRSRGGNFDTSPDSLIALHKAGVSAAELDAIMGASATPATPRPATDNSVTPNPPVTPPSGQKFALPSVTLIQGGASQKIPMEKTQLAQTKTKPTSMKSLASDSVVTQSVQAGVYTATSDIAMHTNSMVGGSAVQEAGSVFSGVLAQRKPAVTYVWGVPNPASTNVLQSDTPAFAVDFSAARRVNPDDFEPVLLKLTPAQNTCRIVGATQGKQDSDASPAADWEIYSHFMEERVPVNAQKLSPGKYQLAPAAELEPGEYAVALRPISKTKKFAGSDIARAQGEGLVFDAVWTFEVPEDK